MTEIPVFRKGKKLYLFDIDGTLVRSFLREKGARFETGVKESKDLYDKIEVLPGRKFHLDLLRAAGKKIALVTNQGGIAFGYQTSEQINRKLCGVCEALGMEDQWGVGGPGRSYSLCMGPAEHRRPSVAYCSLVHPNAKVAEYRCHPLDDWRKPGPGMILQAIEDHGVTREETIFVGDMDTDREAAEAAGVDYVDAYEFFGPSTGDDIEEES